jgi:hypothetical protein
MRGIEAGAASTGWFNSGVSCDAEATRRRIFEAASAAFAARVLAEVRGAGPTGAAR